MMDIAGLALDSAVAVEHGAALGSVASADSNLTERLSVEPDGIQSVQPFVAAAVERKLEPGKIFVVHHSCMDLY